MTSSNSGPPPRDSWVPYCKAKLMTYDEISNRQRLFTAEMATKHGICLTFEHFNLRGFDDDLIRFDGDDIIREMIEKWNKLKLLGWEGVQDRNKLLDSIEWEGKRGYLNRATNYYHQQKNKISDALWLPVFKESLRQTDNISMAKYTQNNQLQRAFAEVLRYSCLYALLVAQVSFFHCKAKPLIIDTAMAKNAKISRYFASIQRFAQWEEEETPNANAKDKICARIRKRCLQYIEAEMMRKFTHFYAIIGGFGSMKDIDFEAFKVNIHFNKQQKAKEFPAFDPTPIISTSYFTMQFYIDNAPKTNDKKDPKKKGKEANKKEPKAHREFQRVSDYGTERRNMNQERERLRSSARQRDIEQNIQQIRHSVNMRNNNINYNTNNYDVNRVEMERRYHPNQVAPYPNNPMLYYQPLQRVHRELMMEYHRLVSFVQRTNHLSMPSYADGAMMYPNPDLSACAGYNDNVYAPMEHVQPGNVYPPSSTNYEVAPSPLMYNDASLVSISPGNNDYVVEGLNPMAIPNFMTRSSPSVTSSEPSSYQWE